MHRTKWIQKKTKCKTQLTLILILLTILLYYNAKFNKCLIYCKTYKCNFFQLFSIPQGNKETKQVCKYLNGKIPNANYFRQRKKSNLVIVFISLYHFSCGTCYSVNSYSSGASISYFRFSGDTIDSTLKNT